MTETLLEHLRMDEDGTDGSLPASQREDSGLGVCGGQHCLVDRLPELENSLRTIVNLLTQEISAAKDREARLLRKVKDLGSQLHSLQAAFERQQHLTSSATTNDDNASLTKLKPKKYSKKYSKEGTSKKIRTFVLEARIPNVIYPQTTSPPTVSLEERSSKCRCSARSMCHPKSCLH